MLVIGRLRIEFYNIINIPDSSDFIQFEVSKTQK